MLFVDNKDFVFCMVSVSVIKSTFATRLVNTDKSRPAPYK